MMDYQSLHSEKPVNVEKELIVKRRAMVIVTSHFKYHTPYIYRIYVLYSCKNEKQKQVK